LQDYLQNPAMTFRLWLRQIAQDRIIDAHRRHRISARRSVDREQALAAPRGYDQSSIQLAGLLSDQALTPEAAALQQEMARRVEAAVSRLEERDSEIIVMRHYEHLSNQEIAHALNLTEPAASMRYLRAIRRLKEILQAGSSDASAG
jgi:RNA polymerase sigma-70 factor (ECF subfamily)